ncbi:TPA: hypothetical protein ACH3X1_012058 [Trebouxia sp. C0004]
MLAVGHVSFIIKPLWTTTAGLIVDFDGRRQQQSGFRSMNCCSTCILFAAMHACSILQSNCLMPASHDDGRISQVEVPVQRQSGNDESRPGIPITSYGITTAAKLYLVQSYILYSAKRILICNMALSSVVHATYITTAL